MTFLSNALTALSELLGNFGLAVVCAVVLCYGLSMPFKMLSERHRNIKKECVPEIQAIRKKYNANAMGVAFEDSANMPDNIKALSHEERENAMFDEISQVYKEHGYKMWVSWIPGVITFALIIILYITIGNANPGGIYASTWVTAMDTSTKMAIAVFAGAMGSAVATNLYSCVVGVITSKRKGTPIKATLVSNFIGTALNIVIMLLVLRAASVAVAIAITTIQALSLLKLIIKDVIRLIQTHSTAK